MDASDKEKIINFADNIKRITKLDEKNYKTKILVVDDEPTLCDTLKFNLEMEGYDVDTARSAEEALGKDLSAYSLVLLDVMMGEISGFQMAKIMKMSPKTADIPIIFCTAKDTDDDQETGFDIGADDYIPKPYSIRNVLTRVKAALRRMSIAHRTGDELKIGKDVLSIEGLKLNLALKSTSVDGRELKLPRKEFEMLALFLAHPGRIYSREEILEKVWPDNVVVLDRVVDVHLANLRSKLGPYSKRIITRSGYGYGFQI